MCRTAAKRITRNDYYNLIMETGKLPKDGEYEIIPLDLSRFVLLSETSKKHLNELFTEETEDSDGNYMLKKHVAVNPNYVMDYAMKRYFNMELTVVDAYSGYGFSDNEMLIYTSAEGDAFMTLFEDRNKYEVEKEKTIQFYKENH